MVTQQSMKERRASQAGRKKPYHRPKIVIFGSIQSLPDASLQAVSQDAARPVAPDDFYFDHHAEDFAVLTH